MFTPDQRANKPKLQLSPEALAIVCVVVVLHAAFLYALAHIGSMNQKPVPSTMAGATATVAASAF
jgi:hypothetical protein